MDCSCSRGGSAMFCEHNMTGVDGDVGLQRKCSCGWAFGENVGRLDRCESCEDYITTLGASRPVEG